MLEYWYIFPIAVIFSTMAMSVGIGGASLFTPFFFLIMKFPAVVAVGVGLFIEMFGFAAGLFGFAKRKLIEYKVGLYLLCFTIPAAVIGALLIKQVPDWAIMSILAILLFVIGIAIMKPEITTTLKHEIHNDECDHGEDKKCYREPKSLTAVQVSGVIGGLMAGLVSAGIGEVNDYVLLRKYKMHGAVAAGTSVFIGALTALTGSLVHLYNITEINPYLFDRIAAMAIFAIPGVLIGTQIGVRTAQVITDRHRDFFIGILFSVLSFVTLLSLLV